MDTQALKLARDASVEGEGSASAAAICFAAGAAIHAQIQNEQNPNQSLLVIPDGYQVVETSAPQQPNLQKGNAHFTSAESFVFYTNKHKRTDTLVYASTESKQPRFVAVYDDHRSFDQNLFLDAENPSGVFAEHRNFRATLGLEWSKEWQTWKEHNRDPMAQLHFATFIEDNIDDIIMPTGADMLTTILDFKTSSEGRFNSKANLHNGSVEFVYTDTVTQASGKISMPTQITINIPVIKHAAPQIIHARLKYRVKDGALMIWYEIIRAHRIEDEAIMNTANYIKHETEVDVLFGTVD